MGLPGKHRFLSDEHTPIDGKGLLINLGSTLDQKGTLPSTFTHADSPGALVVAVAGRDRCSNAQSNEMAQANYDDLSPLP